MRGVPWQANKRLRQPVKVSPTFSNHRDSPRRQSHFLTSRHQTECRDEHARTATHQEESEAGSARGRRNGAASRESNWSIRPCRKVALAPHRLPRSECPKILDVQKQP